MKHLTDWVSPFFRTAYNHDTNATSDESAISNFEETLAVQDAKDECDINTIVKRFGITGQLPSGVRTPTYDDFSGVHDYQSALAAMTSANESFYSMPSEVRSKFDNDPHRFVSYCSDPLNAETLTSWGLTIHEPVIKAPESSPDENKG